MKCPRCVQRIHRAAGSCPHCGFTLTEADLLFGAEDVRLEILTDSAGLLRQRERAAVLKAIHTFNRRLPQFFVAVFTGTLGETGHLRQFGFWLLNRGTFDGIPAEKSNAAGILLVIDAESKAAGITYGYQLDPFLGEGDTFEALSRAHGHWLQGLYAEGIARATAHLTSTLQKRAAQARRDPLRFARRVLPHDKTSDLVARIRAGARKEEAEP